MISRTLLCYAHGREDGWEAICVDLDIAVQGTSFDDVRQSLDRAVTLYIEALGEQDAATTGRLVARTAPLSVRLRWSATLLWHWIRHNRSVSQDSYAGFDLSCRA